MEIIKREAKKQDDALNLACEFLNVNKDEVYYYFEEISGFVLVQNRFGVFAWWH